MLYGVKGKGKLWGVEGEVSSSHEVMEMSMVDVRVAVALEIVPVSTTPA